VNGAKLYYEVTGAGHPLTLLHEGIADSRMYDDQFNAFAQRYCVVCFTDPCLEQTERETHL